MVIRIDCNILFGVEVSARASVLRSTLGRTRCRRLRRLRIAVCRAECLSADATLSMYAFGSAVYGGVSLCRNSFRLSLRYKCSIIKRSRVRSGSGSSTRCLRRYGARNSCILAFRSRANRTSSRCRTRAIIRPRVSRRAVRVSKCLHQYGATSRTSLSRCTSCRRTCIVFSAIHTSRMSATIKRLACAVYIKGCSVVILLRSRTICIYRYNLSRFGIYPRM